jgi:hypothetical protein
MWFGLAVVLVVFAVSVPALQQRSIDATALEGA